MTNGDKGGGVYQNLIFAVTSFLNGPLSNYFSISEEYMNPNNCKSIIIPNLGLAACKLYTLTVKMKSAESD